MPVMMGGGTEAGMELFQLASQKFKSSKGKEEFAPSRGKQEVVKYLETEKNK